MPGPKPLREGGIQAYLAGLILSDFMLGMFFAVFALAIGPTSFRNVDL